MDTKIMDEIEQLRADVAQFKADAPYQYRASQVAERSADLIERLLNALIPADVTPDPEPEAATPAKTTTKTRAAA